MSDIKISVIDEYDGFVIVIHKDGEEDKRYRFDQEDTREEMVDMFHSIGFEAEYEESY